MEKVKYSPSNYNKSVGFNLLLPNQILRPIQLAKQDKIGPLDAFKGCEIPILLDLIKKYKVSTILFSPSVTHVLVHLIISSLNIFSKKCYKHELIIPKSF